MRKEASGDEVKSMLDRLGLVGAAYYRVNIANLDWSNAPNFGMEMDLRVTPDVQTLVVDLESVKFMDSGAIRQLVIVQNNMKEVGRKGVVLLDVPDNIKDNLNMLGFLDLFNVCSSREPQK